MNRILEAGDIQLKCDIPEELLKLTNENKTLKKNISLLMAISLLIVGFAIYKTLKSYNDDNK